MSSDSMAKKDVEFVRNMQADRERNLKEWLEMEKTRSAAVQREMQLHADIAAIRRDVQEIRGLLEQVLSRLPSK